MNSPSTESTVSNVGAILIQLIPYFVGFHSWLIAAATILSVSFRAIYAFESIYLQLGYQSRRITDYIIRWVVPFSSSVLVPAEHFGVFVVLLLVRLVLRSWMHIILSLYLQLVFVLLCVLCPELVTA